MKNIITYSVISSLCIIGCLQEPLNLENEERQRRSYNSVLEAMNWDCSDFDTDYYLSGTLAGEEICFGKGVDGYESFSGLSQAIVTETGSLTFGSGVDEPENAHNYLFYGFFKSGPLEHLVPRFNIGSSYYPLNTSFAEISSQELKIGTYQIAENKVITDIRDGYFFGINTSHIDGGENEYNGSFTLNSYRGPQEDSFFKIIDIKINEDAELRYHTVTAQISCNMYHHVFNQAHEPDFYGRLEADLKIVIEEPLN